MNFRKHAVLLIAGALVLSMASGCSRNPAGADDPSQAPGTTTGDTGNTGGSTGGTGGGSSPIWNPSGGGGQVVTPVTIDAQITNKTMSGILFWKKIKTVTVQVHNPSTQNVSGKIVVTFSKKGQQVETNDSKTFTLAGGQTQTYEVSPTKSSDDAVATANSDQSGTGVGGSTGFGGSTGGFGGIGGTTGNTTGSTTGF